MPKYRRVGSVYKKEDNDVWGWIALGVIVLLVIGAIAG